MNTPKNSDNKVIYYHGKSHDEPFILLRGKGLKLNGVKELLKTNHFYWKFNNGRRRVMAYEAFKTPAEMIEMLLKLQQLGCEIAPYPSLNKKKHFQIEPLNILE